MGLILHVGVDDTDSLSGGCTTYVAVLLVESFSKIEGLSFLDYPCLVRLNPNIPWKTRGNGAVCLRLNLKDEDLYSEVKFSAIKLVEENLERFGGEAEAGLAFLKGEVPEDLKKLASKAEWTVVEKGECLKLFADAGGEVEGFHGGRGIIGAIAAIGETLEADHTYELLAYRKPENWGKPRSLNPASVKKMAEATKHETFGNLDPETGRVLVTPRGPDPVYFGVRGETPAAVLKAAKMLELGEPVERWAVFRSNQGTDAHLKTVKAVSQVPAYSCVTVEGHVSHAPRRFPGGHVIFKVEDGTGILACATYEPTGDLTKIAAELVVGDRVRIYGGLRKAEPVLEATLNLEKLEVLEAVRTFRKVNPLCPKCGRRMKSMGAGKGFRCPKCRHRSVKAEKASVETERKLKPDLYLAAPRAHRHLTKPEERYGLEKTVMPGVYLKLRPKVFWGYGWPPP
ncbi:MAG: TiaS agmantine-binding domain-containing protein [Candidatus Hecatellaceae archaeon]